MSDTTTASGTVTIDGFAPVQGPATNTGTVMIDAGGTLQLVSGMFTNDGSVDILSGGTLVATSASAIDDGTVTNAGVLDLSGDTAGTFLVDGLVTNTGTVLVGGTVTIGTGTLVNEGTLDVVAGGTLLAGAAASGFDDGTVNNAGVIDLTGSNGLLTVEGAVTNTGTIVIGDTVALGSASFVNDGTLDILAGGTLIASAATTGSDAGTVNNAGLIDLTDAGSTLDVGGPVSNTGTIILGDTVSTSSGTFDNAGTLVGAGGTLEGTATLLDDGTVLSGPSLTIDTSVTGTGTLDIGTGSSTLALGSTVAAGDKIDFTGEGGDLVLGNGDSVAATINGFVDDNEIDLTSLAYTGETTLSYSPATDQLTVDESGISQTVIVSGVTFAEFEGIIVTSDGHGGTLIEAPCFALGTAIDTPAGPRAVEQLAPGDHVSLHAGGAAAVTWIGHRRRADTRMVRLLPHALGENMPREALCVSHDHALLVDGVLVPAELLVNGRSILAETWDEAVLFHVELEHHAVLSAAGAPAESYLDSGNRAQFGNCPISYDAAEPGAEPCAEMVVAGARLERARATIEALAVHMVVGA